MKTVSCESGGQGLGRAACGSYLCHVWTTVFVCGVGVLGVSIALVPFMWRTSGTFSIQLSSKFIAQMAGRRVARVRIKSNQIIMKRKKEEKKSC